MATFESKSVTLNAPCEKVYSFLNDFRNVESLMPEQIINWQASSDECSFTIQGISSLSMKIDSRSANRNIHIVSHGKNPVNYSMDYFFREKEDGTCRVRIILDADLNPFIRGMASRPLQNLVDIMAEKLQSIF